RERPTQRSAGGKPNVRPSPVLVHDAGLAATVCIYFVGTQVYARVVADSLPPLLANWGPEGNVVTAGVEVAVNYAYPYFNNHCATIDPRTSTLHYIFGDAGGGPGSPGYMKGTVTVSRADPTSCRVAWTSPL